MSFLVAKATQAFTAICNSVSQWVSHTFCVTPPQPIRTLHPIKSNHQKVNTVQLYCLLFIIEWWLDLILYTSYRPTQLIINQWESSMMKSSTNEREAWWNHQPMREKHDEIMSQWESSMLKSSAQIQLLL